MEEKDKPHDLEDTLSLTKQEVETKVIRRKMNSYEEAIFQYGFNIGFNYGMSLIDQRDNFDQNE